MIRDKQKADAIKEAARLARRRGYAKTGRERERARRLAESGLADLPPEITAAMEENPAQPKEPEPAPVQADDSVANLVARLTAIRERIWRLQSMFAVSLSQETAIEANNYLQLFQTLAERLKQRDPTAFSDLVSGHESLLQSPALPLKQSIPLATQRLCEMRWQVSQAPAQRAPKPPTVPDGLDWLLT